MLKRLWLILGPVLCAFLLVSGILLVYPTNLVHRFQEEKRLAVTLNSGTFKSRTQKMTAFTDSNHRFVPFFGSSEWLRFDSMHPAVLAEKYNRNYIPYFLGERGTSSLNQYFGMQQMLPALENKSVVYVLSPQWFTLKGYKTAAFQQYFNSGQLMSFLKNQENDDVSRYAAKRLLTLEPMITMKTILKKVANGKELTKFEKNYIEFRRQITRREDRFFSDIIVKPNNHYDEKIAPQLKRLPEEFSYEALSRLAVEDARAQTKSNSFGIKDEFYYKKVYHNLKKLKNSQKNFSYLKSREYNDLQLVLNQFAISKTNPIFVIPPVNDKWADYTGLNKDRYQEAIEKIKYQLKSQGFTNIVDLSRKGNVPYFMEDTIHLGWLGWLEFDKAVAPFLSQSIPTPNYHINNHFLSRKWANYTGDYSDFVTNGK